MFLNSLKEENKNGFLKLCIFAALANDEFAEEEKEMIYAYCREMNIPETVPDAEGSVEDLLECINKGTTESEKKIIILEILGLLKSDGVYDEKEEKFMEKVIHGLDIKEEVLDKVNRLLDQYLDLYRELYLTIS